MYVSININLRDVLKEAGPLQIESLVKSNAPILRGRTAQHDIGAAIGNAAIGALSRGSGGARASIGAEIGSRTALRLSLAT
jgi:hypothetical protein